MGTVRGIPAWVIGEFTGTFILVFFGCGTPLLAYFIAWIVIPNEPYFFTTTPFTQPYTPPAPQPAAPSDSPTA